jgi:alpha-D-ribose 1-methylphosphonate 5-triphosphate synthase subunit PhnG
MGVLELDRTERAAVLSRINASDACRMAAIVTDGSLGEVQIITPPTVGTVMVRAADSAGGEVFNLGEVVVSQARVSLAGHDGWAMVVGHEPERALALAIVDAALEAGHRASLALGRAIAESVAAADKLAQRELDEVASTRVKFDVF